MADSAAFEWLCSELEARTSLDRLESRGTVRLALKQAGLEPRTVTPDQIRVVVERVLPGELRARGIEGESAICSALAGTAMPAGLAPGSAEAPDEIFRRLGG